MSNPESNYLAQSRSWKEGMRYRISPESYPVSRKQYRDLQACGQTIGDYLNTRYSRSIIEFRLDMVKDETDKLWIMEIQTDDRGMPAMANARNARGPSSRLPGLMETLNDGLTQKNQSPEYCLAFVFPDLEYFYYAGLYDVRYILRAINPRSEIVVTPRSEVTQQGELLITSPRFSGAEIPFRPNFIWDFSNTISGSAVIQTKVDKSAIFKPWQQPGTQTESVEIPVREYIPEVRFPNDPDVIANKNNWILKAIDSRWSKGLFFGKDTDIFTWNGLCKNNSDSYIAQKFIYPQKEFFEVKSAKTDELFRQPFIARVEPYYVKISDRWILADILATCTQSQPIHGSRDCIMIPAEII